MTRRHERTTSNNHEGKEHLFFRALNDN